MNKTFSEQITEAIREAVDTVYDGARTKAASACGTSYSTLCRWYAGDTSPRIEDIAKLMDLAGYELVKKGEKASSEFQFECPDNLAKQDEMEFEATKFVAVPVVKDVDQLTNYVSASNRSGWALVDKKSKSIQGRNNMIAMMVTDNLMAPTLHPEDMLLIDRDMVTPISGRMYLVRSPDGKRTAIRRITFKEDGKDTFIFCMNDNHAIARAEIYSINQDYGGDFKKAILGQVVWVRADASDK